MKRFVLVATLVIGIFGSGSKANAVRCFWATETAWGWDGPGIYSGKACYTDDGLQELYFKPLIPVLTF